MPIFGFGKKKEDEIEKLKEKYISELKQEQKPIEPLPSISQTQTSTKELEERIKLLETKIESIRAQLDLINSKLEEIKFLLKR